MASTAREAIFIRHGQSRANIGDWDGGFAEVPLTPLGHEQARVLAESWTTTPGLIVVSPYLRAQQTAAPMIARYPNVPVETWPVHEYTFWDPVFWGGTPPLEAMEDVQRYWRIADPDVRRPEPHPGSENFNDLLDRTEQTLERLAALDCNRPVLLFTHGHFMQALRHTLKWPHWDRAQKMANFHAYDAQFHVLNTECMTVTWDERKQWQLA